MAIPRIATLCFYARQSFRSETFVGLLLSAWFLSGCAVVPMRTRTVGWTGTEKQLDLSFIEVSKTNPNEVADKLAWMDTGIAHPRLFWGRWYRSSSGAAFPVDAGGFPLPMASRNWRVQNLLVEFNESGAVERYGNFSNSELSGEIVRWFRETSEPPLNLSPPLVIHGTMTLTEDSVQFLRWNESPFSVPRTDISKFELRGTWWTPGDSGSAPSDISVEFLFSSKRPSNKGCKCLLMSVSPANYLTLLQYIPPAATRR